MQKQEFETARATANNATAGSRTGRGASAGSGIKKRSRGGIGVECVRSGTLGVLGLLLSLRQMMFSTHPLAFALLAASTRHAPAVLLGVIVGAISGEGIALERIVGALVCTAARIASKMLLDTAKGEGEGDRGREKIKLRDDPLTYLSRLFSEHRYLRMMSGAVGTFVTGIWRIIAGGFRFYDLFGAVVYLILTPAATWLMSYWFDRDEKKRELGSAFSEQLDGGGIGRISNARITEISALVLRATAVYALGDTSLIGISLPLLLGLLLTLRASKRSILHGLVEGLVLGLACSPSYAPMLAFCALAYASISRLSRLGGGLAACISGLTWGMYVGGVSELGILLPTLLGGTMTYCVAERMGTVEEIEEFFEYTESMRINTDGESLLEDGLLAERINAQRNDRLRAISDSFSSLSEIFYNLSTRLKRPSALDLHNICEDSFDKVCADCENREICFGAEYGATLEIMKRITVKLHNTGAVDEKKLPATFKMRCRRVGELTDEINHACAVATRRAFQNEKTEIFALDYDAVARILNDAIAENEEEFRCDRQMARRVSQAINEEGYGEHTAVVFGKRKLNILARGLELSDGGADVRKLRERLEDVVRVPLCEPTFELSCGSVNMQMSARRAFSADSAYSVLAGEGESICGDTVSIFENQNGYLYALISDGMGRGRNAALASEMCNAFLRNMLGAGNRMEASIRMLNSVLCARSSQSENECSATVDLVQIDLYSGEMSLVKSGAAPTFLVRRGNVFKLASPSLPIGILHALDAKQIDISCEDGDLVVMTSDGAARDGEEWEYLSEMLRNPTIADEKPQNIAEQIIRRARAEMKNCDDTSVVVIRVKREQTKW